MQRPTQQLIVLHSDPRLLAAARGLVEECYVLHFARGWPCVSKLADRPSALLLVDPHHDSEGEGPSTSLRNLLQDAPMLPVVVALDSRHHWMEDVRILGSWGVEEILDINSEASAAALRRRLENARARPMRRLIHYALAPRIPAQALAILEAAAGVVAEGGGPRDLARNLFMHRDTLHRWCGRNGLPSTRQLLSWMRLLLAAELLDHSRFSLTQIAMACGYSTDGALRAAMQQRLGRSPGELRRTGAFTAVSTRFLSEIRLSGRGGDSRTPAVHS